MPTIKTIKPAGGGDYTSLQAWWEDWASQQATADQWAECYSGDCGFLSTFEHPQASTSDSSHYFRIYAAENETPSSVHIFFDLATEHYSRVEGMRLTGNYCFYCAGCEGVRLERCRIDGTVEVQPGPGVPVVIANNVIDAVDAYAAVLIDNGGGDVLVANNTLLLKADLSPEMTTAVLIGESLLSGTLTIENNIFIGDGGPEPVSYLGVVDFVEISSVALNHNVGNDATLSLWGGTGNQNNVDPNDLFEDFAGGDFRLKTGSPAINAGKTLAQVSGDYLGVSRPQGAAFDIGAYEYPEAAPLPTGGPRGPTALARRNRFATLGRPAP